MYLLFVLMGHLSGDESKRSLVQSLQIFALSSSTFCMCWENDNDQQ